MEPIYREAIRGIVYVEVNFKYGDPSYCVTTENVIIFCCMKVENVCQKSQSALRDRMCNPYWHVNV